MKDFAMKIKKLFTGNSLKYTVTILLCVVFFCFIDENNVIVTGQLRKEVLDLHREEAELYKDFQADSIEAANLKNNLDAIERFGREHYYMKTADEDIFIITTNDPKRPVV